MAVLGIFTVKKLIHYNGSYFTYGGFGEYLAGIRPYFERTILVAHVSRGLPLAGYYVIPPERLEVIHLPATSSELGVLLSVPIMFYRCWRVARQVSVAHTRLPDYTGIIGAVVCKIHKVPYFCQIVADWAVQARSLSPWKRGGLGLLLKAHLLLYDFFEKCVSKKQIVFAQGITCYQKHASQSDAQLVVSTSHHTQDIILPRPVFQDPPFTILNVGRLDSVKNQELLLRALGELNAVVPKWRVTLVGQGSQETYLRRLARSLGVADWVRFCGQVVHGTSLWEYYDAADVFVLTSRSEGTPKVVLEAMCRGVPVIASAVGGVPSQLANNQRGLLFEDNNLASLVSAIMTVEQNVSIRNTITAQAHEYVKSVTVEAVTAQMISKVFTRWPHLVS